MFIPDFPKSNFRFLVPSSGRKCLARSARGLHISVLVRAERLFLSAPGLSEALSCHLPPKGRRNEGMREAGRHFNA
jgi:hypothetical protein